jgi:hypothetical protein
MHATEVPFGKGREDDLHKVLLRLASRVARFDAFYDCIHWNALGRISHVFLVPRYHFLAKPLFHSRVPLQQCPYAVAYDLANGRIGSRPNFALTISAISSGNVMLNCCVVLISDTQRFIITWNRIKSY